MPRTKQTALEPASKPVARQPASPVQPHVGHHTPSGVLYYCYQTAIDKATDDLGELLQRKCEANVHKALMKIFIHQKLSRVLDTGVRVNDSFASAL